MPATVTDRLFGESSSVAVKAPCIAVSTSNITLSGLQTVNGVPVSDGDRVLVTAQLNPIYNGIYNASSSGWIRTGDFDGNRDAIQGTRVLVASPGSSLATEYELISANPIIIGTSTLTFVMRYGANATYDRTANEIAVGAVPSSLLYVAEPSIDLRRYLFRASNSAVDNLSALNEAISVFTVGGGNIIFPRGSFNINEFAFPASVVGVGSGKFATQLNYANALTFATLGGVGSSLYYGCGLKNLRILLTNKDAEALRVQGCAGADIDNLYIEGPLISGRGNRGVVIDGGNASSFFNSVRNVQCNHMQNGFRMLQSGSQVCTQTKFDNCDSLGDVSGVGTTSVGFTVDAGQGNGSLWISGNFESCGTGIHVTSVSGSASVFGARFEGNTTDILFDVTPDAWSFFGLLNLDPAKVIDNSGTGYERHHFVGCIDGSGANYGDIFPGQVTFTPQSTSDVAITITCYPTQTGVIYRVKNSAGTPMIEFNAAGEISTLANQPVKLTAGSGSPEGVKTAGPGSVYSDVGGALYLKVTGSGNTGWKSITHA